MSDLASNVEKSVTTEMKALRTAKKELRKAIRSRLSSLPQEYIDRQCLWSHDYSPEANLIY